MKRSTQLIIVILLVAFVTPIIYIALVAKDALKVKDWIVEHVSVDDKKIYSYSLEINAADAQAVPPCNIHINTYKGVVDSLNPVFFVAAAGGVDAKCEDSHIVVTLGDLKDLVADDLCLTIEVPQNARLKIVNHVPQTHLSLVGGDYGAIYVDAKSNLMMADVNVGGVLSVDTTALKKIVVDDSNIGAMKVNGKNIELDIKDSNVGALSISGTCERIVFADGHIGVCAWNNDCATKAVIDDCSIVSRVVEDVLSVTIADFENESFTSVNALPDSTGAMYIEGDDGEKVNITPTNVNVEGSDGEKVSITPLGIHVDDGETTVEIGPGGIVVKEDGKSIVNVGVGGVSVTE